MDQLPQMAFSHIGLYVTDMECMASLRLHAKLKALGVSGLNPTNHGGSWSVYFSDPEGNRIELFAQTPWYVPPISVSLVRGCRART